MKRISPDEYQEEEVSRLTPDWDKKVIGAHTINAAGDLTVIDCLIKTSRLYSGPGIEMARSRVPQIHAPKENVLQLIHSFIQGGSERQMIQLTRLLLESGKYRVHVACLNGGGALRPEVDEFGLNEIREFPLTSFYDRNMLLQLRRFSEFLKEHNIRLVHTHDFYSNIFGMAGAALAGIPVRIASRRETSGMRSPAQKRVERLSFNLAHEVITNAEAVRDQLASEGVNRNKISVVYNGLDLERLTPRSITRAGALALLGLPVELASTGQKFVTIVANLQHEVKDHAMFLRSARRVIEVMPDTLFLLAGEGRLIESTRALAQELGVNSNT
ncbi:MAG: glycosyltransferase, partial [Pyrinomonadaceae bacterium]